MTLKCAEMCWNILKCTQSLTGISHLSTTRNSTKSYTKQNPPISIIPSKITVIWYQQCRECGLTRVGKPGFMHYLLSLCETFQWAESRGRVHFSRRHLEAPLAPCKWIALKCAEMRWNALKCPQSLTGISHLSTARNSTKSYTKQNPPISIIPLCETLR